MKRLTISWLSLALIGLAWAARVPYADAKLYMECKSNVKNIATACEMFATDHQGNYPASLQELVKGHYLTGVPTCPAAGKDTYSASYKCQNSRGKFFFRFLCAGPNHVKAGSNPNRPAYDSDFGLHEGNS